VRTLRSFEHQEWQGLRSRRRSRPKQPYSDQPRLTRVFQGHKCSSAALLLLENRPPLCFRSKSAAPSDLLVDKRLRTTRHLQQPYSDQQQGRGNLTRINSMAVGFPGAWQKCSTV
jgi:hypothetical protein